MLSSANRFTPIKVTYLHPCSNDHRWSLLEEVHQGLFFCVSEHQNNSEESENRPSKHGVSSLEKHDSDVPLATKSYVVYF